MVKTKIGIIGPPGVGKTTLTSLLFSKLKIDSYDAEIVPELAKRNLYQGRDFSSLGFDIRMTLEQKEFEESYSLSEHVFDYLICEAPLCNGFFYSSFYNKELEYPLLFEIAKQEIQKYDIIVFLTYKSKDFYVETGRLESFEKSIMLEDHIRSSFKKLGHQKAFIETHPRAALDDVYSFISQKEQETSALH